RLHVLVRAPGAAAPAIAAGSRGRVDSRVPGEDDFRTGPAISVSGLLILAEAHLGKVGVDRRPVVNTQKQPGEDDGQLASAAVSAPGRPPGLTGPAHARQ